jgi:translation initiation factor 1A
MGKKKVISEEELKELVYPGPRQVIGFVSQLLGYDRVRVKCADGLERLCRIRGKMKRRVWVRMGDAVLVEPWDFQYNERGDILWRYTKSQVGTLRERGYLPAR